MTFAPVALFVFNRPHHTERTIQALAANCLASETDLFIFADGARDDRDTPSVEAVRQLLGHVQGFRSVSIEASPSNRGLSRSILRGIDRVLQRHETVIVIEDDLLCAPSFLGFTNLALAKYRDVPAVFSISGHRPNGIRVPSDYGFDAFFSPRMMGWGWATWRDRWQQHDPAVGGFAAFASNPTLRAAFDQGGSDLSWLLDLQMSGRIEGWDVAWMFTHFRHHGLCLSPVRSYVENIGFDGSGTHQVADPRMRADNSRAVADPRLPDFPFVDARILRSIARHHQRVDLLTRVWGRLARTFYAMRYAGTALRSWNRSWS